MGAMDIAKALAVMNRVNITDRIYEQAYGGTPLEDVIKRGAWNAPSAARLMAKKDGEVIRIPGHTGGNPNAATPVKEGRGYPAGGSQTYANTYWHSRGRKSSLRRTIEAMLKAAGNEQSMFDVIGQETKYHRDDWRKRTNWAMFRDGSGLLCKVRGSSAWTYTTGVLAVDDASRCAIGTELTVRALQAATATTGWTTSTSANGETVMIPAVVTARDLTPGANTITITYYNGGAIGALSGATSLDGMGVYFGDSQGADIYGLQAVCGYQNDQNHGVNPSSPGNNEFGYLKTFGGVDRGVAAGEWFKAYYLSLAGAVISVADHIDPLMYTMIGRDESLRGAGGRLLYGMTDSTRFSKIVRCMTAGQITFQRTKLVDGKWDAVDYGIFRFGYDPQDCPKGSSSASYGRIFFFPMDHLYVLELEPLHMEMDDGGSQRLLDGIGRRTSVVEAYMSEMAQLCCPSCLGCAQLDNVG